MNDHERIRADALREMRDIVEHCISNMDNILYQLNRETLALMQKPEVDNLVWFECVNCGHQTQTLHTVKTSKLLTTQEEIKMAQEDRPQYYGPGVDDKTEPSEAEIEKMLTCDLSAVPEVAEALNKAEYIQAAYNASQDPVDTNGCGPEVFYEAVAELAKKYERSCGNCVVKSKDWHMDRIPPCYKCKDYSHHQPKEGK